MMGGGPPPSDENGKAIGSFLDKVKNGTVTESDLTDLQELLTSIQEESDSTEEASTTTSDTSSIKDSVESFLDKVKAGTVTEDDLTDLKNTLDQMPPMTGGVSSYSSTGSIEDFLSYLESANSTDSSQSRTYTAQQLLQALKAYENSGYKDYFSDSWQNYA